MRPKGSAEALEARRQRAATLLERGSGIREVARQVGIERVLAEVMPQDKFLMGP